MGVTIPLLDNWLYIRYEKNNELNKSILSGADSPVFGWFEQKKQDGMGGKNYTENVWSGQKKTSSRDSQTTHNRNRAGATGGRETFIHNMIPNFDDTHIERETLLASSSNVGSFVNNFMEDMDQSKKSMETDMLGYIYGTGDRSGRIGQVASISGSSITLTSGTIAQQFENDMYVEIAAAKYDGTNDRRRVTGGARLVKITNYDHYTKTVTFGTAPTGLAVGDSIWKEGDYLESNKTNQHTGILDYSPQSLSPGELFQNVDRSKSPARLSGLYDSVEDSSEGTDSGEKIYNKIVDIVTKHCSVFPKYGVDKLVAGPLIMGALQKSSIFKNGVRWIESDDEKRRSGAIGFSAFKVLSAKGEIPMVFDPYCPEGEILGLHTPSWKLKYLSESKGMIINFKKQSGSRILVAQDGTNNNMVKLESYHYTSCSLPGANLRLKVNASL